MSGKVPPKPVYNTHLNDNVFAMFMQMMEAKRKFDQNKATYHNVYTPCASEPEEDNTHQESEFN